jgi:hypothetical protein
MPRVLANFQLPDLAPLAKRIRETSVPEEPEVAKELCALQLLPA